MALRDVTQTGLEVELGGKRYHLSPLDDQDHADLDSFVQSKFIDNARRSVPEDAPQAVFDSVMAVAMRQAMGLSWLFDPGKRVMRTVEGHAMVAWTAIKHRHPDADYKEIRAALMHPKTLSYFVAMHRKVNELPAMGGDKGAANGKPRPRSRASASTRRSRGRPGTPSRK